jgi:mannose-6-phosphate isomerase-like protein (cupin superfamily)
MTVHKHSCSNPEKVSETFRRSVIHLDNLMVVICDFTNGPAPEPDPPHSHPHEQITYVAKGELYLFIGNEKHHLEEGDIFAVPSGMPHCIQNISGHVRLIDSFTPVRSDFLK